MNTKKSSVYIATALLLVPMLFSNSVPNRVIVSAHSGDALTAWASAVPTIDGVISSGEWDDADSVGILLEYSDLLPETLVHEATIYAKNDETYLFLAVVVEADDYDPNDFGNWWFENDHDGVINVGDDGLSIRSDGLSTDSYRTKAVEGWWSSDLYDEGTNDIVGAASHTNPGGVGDYTFEYRHPLDTADDAHDFSLEPGDTVGCKFRYADGGPGVGGDAWPEVPDYGDIVIAGPDTTPPQIVEGPGVSAKTTNSALISWDTDEDSDSVVKYDNAAGRYRFERKDSKIVRNHRITLTGLEPSTVYHFVAQSTDSSENTVTSKDLTFATLASPDEEDPVVSIIDPGICSETVIISATASDNIGVKKVEFYVEGELAFTDYSPPYKFPWDTTEYATGSYATEAKAPLDYDLPGEINVDLQAKVFDLSDRFSVATLSIPVLELRPDLAPPSVEITSPSQGETVSETITVEAEASDNVAVDRVEFYVDDEYKACDETAPYTYVWNTQTVHNGLHTVKAVAFDTSGWTDYYEIEVTTSNLEVLLPIVVVTRAETIWYWPTGFQVGLTVRNLGGATANEIEIIDRVTGFQILPYYLREIDGLPQRFYANPSAEPSPPWAPPCEIHFRTFDLNPGESTEIHYFIIPILPAMDEEFFLDPYFYMTTYYIGTSTSLSYRGPDGELYAEDLSIPKFFVESLRPGDGSWPLYMAVEEAFSNADYVIVTNPTRLFDLYTDLHVDALLASMAELAGLKYGVLGHLWREDRREFEAGELNRYVQPGGAWASQLHPRFSEPLGGYLLIVGETEIVPSYNVAGFDRTFSDGTYVDVVYQTDNPYATTTGDHAPELIVGRIIGDNAAGLRVPILASIAVHVGFRGFGFERSDALLVSGGNADRFVNDVNAMGDILDAEFNVDIVHWRDYPNSWDMYNAFVNAVPDNDVICFRDHGGVDCWCYGLNIGVMPGFINLGDKNPFAFALACLAGNYERGDDYNIAEFFLDSGVAVYIGSTEVSPGSLNSDAGKRFFRTWEASESIGEALTAMERERLRSDGAWWKYWVYEYNLYGDPKYGSVAEPPIVKDQAQEWLDRSFWFDDTVFRWQEFKPDHTSLSRIDLCIEKVGNPDDLHVMIKNRLEDIVWEAFVPEETVQTGWVHIAVSPSVPLIPDDSYYIYVWSDTDSPSPDNRYFWRGQTDSDYGRGISSVESDWPGYDFAFRTWSASSGAASTAPLAQKALQAPLSSLEVVMPDYEVTTIDGFDYVDIPDGMLLLVEDKPRVPYYAVSVDYPKGYEIQDVVLAERSGLITATGLNLTTVTMQPASSTSSKSSPAEGEDWYPEETYTWRTFENPNGSVTLVITVYPFYYDPLTTDIRFYKNYSFDIDYTFSSVEITSLTTGKDVYQQGDTVMIDIMLNNPGEAQDVVVNALIKRYVSEEMVDGLLLSTLDDLTGEASFSPQWDSEGFDPGNYYAEVTLKDTDGTVLDRKTEIFSLTEPDVEPPSIGTVSQEPEIPDDSEIVTIRANVTDAETGVRNVTLSYSTDGGENWNNVTMEWTTGDTYEGEIPGLPADTDVQYKIIACDNTNNTAVQDNAGQYYIYTVIPEFPTWTIMLIIFIVLTVAIAIHKRRLIKTRIHQQPSSPFYL